MLGPRNSTLSTCWPAEQREELQCGPGGGWGGRPCWCAGPGRRPETLRPAGSIAGGQVGVTERHVGAGPGTGVAEVHDVGWAEPRPRRLIASVQPPVDLARIQLLGGGLGDRDALGLGQREPRTRPGRPGPGGPARSYAVAPFGATIRTLTVELPDPNVARAAGAHAVTRLLPNSCTATGVTTTTPEALSADGELRSRTFLDG